MLRTIRLLLFVGLPLLALPGSAVSEADPSAPVPREDPLAQNRRILKENWKKDGQHWSRLKRDLEAFWSMTPERRALIRKLDQDLHQEDSVTQKQLWSVMERYSAWLERLPKDKRARIDGAGDTDERLRIVREMRDEEWIESLPLPVRSHLRRLPVEEQPAEMKRLREEQRQRQHDATNVLPRPPRPRPARPLSLNDFPADVQLFVQDSLKPLLTPEEREELAKANGRPWPVLAHKIHELSARYPIPFPGPIGPVRVADLPARAQEAIGKMPTQRTRALREAEGNWPAFGIALHELQPGRKHLQARHLPSEPRDFGRAVEEFINGPLDGKLSKDEREALKGSQGKWPEYPRLLLELSRKYGLTIPGMTLPGPAAFWKDAQTALPEVPERSLFPFVLSEWLGLTEEGPARPMGDPSLKAKAKEEYFKKNPRELKRLKTLDAEGQPRPRPKRVD